MPQQARIGTKKQIEARITKAYGAVAGGVQIPIMETVTIWNLAERAVYDGADDEALRKVIGDYVETVRTN